MKFICGGAISVLCLFGAGLPVFAQKTSLTPTSLAFGNEVMGQASSAKTARFSNNQNVPITISGIAIAGGNAAGDYAWTSACPLAPLTLAAQKSCTISVTFTPLSLKSRTASLTVTNSISNQTTALSGTGTPPITISALSLTFPSRLVGTTSAAQTVTVTNHLNSELLFSSIAASQNFAVAVNTCGSGIGAGSMCSLGVTFTPTTIGLLQDTLTIIDSAFGSPSVVALNGTGNDTGLTSIIVSPPNSSLAVGNAEQFTATGKFKNGSTANLTASVTWSTSAPVVATITTVGLASGIAPGSTNIGATIGNISGSTALTVTGATLTSIAVTPANTSISAGSTQPFTAIGTYSDASTQNLTNTVAWSSSAGNVATISNAPGTQGLSTGVAPGSTTITATSAGISGSTGLTVSGGFVSTGSMNAARDWHTATVLNNGMVLIAGGGNSGGFAATAELYNPATATFALTGNLNTSRQFHTGTLLNNGAVLIVGGYASGGALSAAELYNPASGTFTSTANLNTARYSHTATMLNNGMVLIVGGFSSAGVLASAELYNPATGMFTSTGSLNLARWSHTATLLNNGMVLIAGGFGSSGFLGSAELYNPASGTFTPTGVLNTARENHTATLLNNGSVLLAGGFGTSGFETSAELYNAATGTFAFTGSMAAARENHTATLLNNGIVLAGGGTGSGGVLNSAELYDPIAGIFSPAGNLTTARENHSAALLNNGTVLLAGGVGSAAYLPNAELYEPGSFTPSNLVSISLSPMNQTIPLATAQPFVATGVFGDGSSQQLASVAWSSSNPMVSSISGDASDPGTAFAVAGGTATVSACTGSVCGSTNLTVGAPTLVSIAVTPATATLTMNASQQFDAVGTYSDGSTTDVTSTATWSSSVMTVATIASGGLASGVSVGATRVSASLSNISGSTNLTVTAVSLVSMALTPANTSIVTGSTQQFLVTGTFSDASTQNLTSAVTWGSSLPSVATVSNAPGAQGLSTAIAPGGTSITATSGAISGSTALTVANAVATGVLTQYSLTWGGLQRIYYVYVPKVIAPIPSVVVFLHDTWTTPTIPLDLVPQWEAVADQYGFFVVWPISTYLSTYNSWHWDCDGCESGFPVPPDDSGFIRSAILAVQNQYSVSPGQTFVTGMSSGGYMAQRIGMEQSDVLAAIAPVSGAQYIQPTGTTFVAPLVPNPVSVYRLNGDLDTVVPYCGGIKGFWNNVRAYTPSVDSDVDFWAGPNANSCTSMAQSQPVCTNGFATNGVYVQDATGCNGGTEVVSEREIGVAHVWPPGTETKVWEFFQIHAR